MNEARALSEAADGGNWLLNGRSFDEQHFSPLKEITDKNVSGLALAWFLDIDSGMGVVAEPIIIAQKFTAQALTLIRAAEGE